ncbi:MAG: hypothetical protein RIF36_03935 [Imperialibacter sp.]|uniref:hypothetical protein n=1 Tax=Imperialibacter sp. TaxID=2038411 RepID=UPI0032EACAAA
METQEIIMYVVIIIACVAPVVWFARTASSKSRLILKSIKTVTGKLPAQYDVWTDRGMAFDTITSRLVFVNNSQPEVITQVIQSDEIIDAHVLVNGKKAADSKKTIDPANVNTIVLQLISSSKDNGEILLSFFDVNSDGPFHANIHYQLARKWKKTILERPVLNHA